MAAAMGFLGFGRKKERKETVTDPVCGMRVDPGKAAGQETVEGRTYHFCSVGCLTKFKQEPARYYAPTTPTPGPR